MVRDLLALDEEFDPNSANFEDDDALNDPADLENSDRIHNNDVSEQIKEVVEFYEEIGSMSDVKNRDILDEQGLLTGYS